MMCLESLQIVVDLGRQLIKCVWAYALLDVRCGQLEAQTEEAGTAGSEHTSSASNEEADRTNSPGRSKEDRELQCSRVAAHVRRLMPLGVGLGTHAR